MHSPELVIFDCDGVLVDSEIIAARGESESAGQGRLRDIARRSGARLCRTYLQGHPVEDREGRRPGACRQASSRKRKSWSISGSRATCAPSRVPWMPWRRCERRNACVPIRAASASASRWAKPGSCRYSPMPSFGRRGRRQGCRKSRTPTCSCTPQAAMKADPRRSFVDRGFGAWHLPAPKGRPGHARHRLHRRQPQASPVTRMR